MCSSDLRCFRRKKAVQPTVEPFVKDRNCFMGWSRELLRVDDEEIARMQDEIKDISEEIALLKREVKISTDEEINSLEQQCLDTENAVMEQKQLRQRLAKSEKRMHEKEEAEEREYGASAKAGDSDSMREAYRAVEHKFRIRALKAFWRARFNSDEKFKGDMEHGEMSEDTIDLRRYGAAYSGTQTVRDFE